MRGNYLNPIATSAGLSGSNSIILACDTDLRPNINVGGFVSIYNLSDTERTKHFVNRKNIDANNNLVTQPVTIAKILNTQNGSKNCYLVPALASYNINGYKGGTTIVNLSDISSDHGSHIIGMIIDITTDGTYYYYSIITSGYSDVLPIGLEDFLSPPFPFTPPESNVFYFEKSYSPNDSVEYPSNMQIVASKYDIIADQFPSAYLQHKAGSFYGNNFILDIGLSNTVYESNELQLRSTQSSNNTGNNFLINGNFEVWQRDNTGKNSAYTNTGNVIFADLWRRRDGITGSDGTKSYYIIRRTFDEYQNEIESNPNYYLDIKALGLSAMGISGTSGGYTASDHLFVGHVVPGAKKFDNQLVTFNFYGKCSSDNYVVNIYFSRYSGNSLLDYQKLGEVILNTTWSLYSVSNLISYLDNDGVDIDLENDYCEVGFDFIPAIEQANINGITLGQDLYFSIASASLGVGSAISIYPDYPEQLKYCQQFYYSTYDKDQNIGTQTMSDVTTPTQNVESIFIQPNKSCNLFKWPTRMRVAPSVTFYSPYSGLSGRAYNKTASTESTQFDTINTSGTIGYNNQIRNGNNASISGTPTVHGVNVCLSNGYVLYDEVHFHIIADADFTL